MKAKITKVSKNSNDLFAPQIDVEVKYTKDDFERKYIFTFPHEEFKDMDQATLEKKIKQIGEYFKETIKKNDDMVSQETTLKTFEDLEVDI